MVSIEHIGICVDDIEKYVNIFEKLGGKLDFIGVAREFEAKCAFIEFENTVIELIKSTVPGNHLDRFNKKRGNALHHIAISGKGNIRGAKPCMFVDFLDLNETGKILIEEVEYK